MSAVRRVWDIHGGVHPPENKHQSLKTPIEQAPMADELVLPFSQHIGAPAEAIVAVGDKVLKGQMIAKPAGFVSVPVHAPTSGEVIAIELRDVPHSSGMQAPCIVIKTDGQDQWIDHKGVEDFSQLDKAELVDIIRNAGIAGMGGAGFPSAVKLNTRPDAKIESLIINGTECEPYITADDILMRERADQIVQGALILKHIIQPSKEAIIGVEDNKPEGIAALQKAAEGTDIEIVTFPTKYPSGGEKQLIQILTGKEVPSGGLPADIGVVCQNIGSTVAIYRAVVHGEPLISRITTVTGYACEKQQNYEVLLGTPMQTLLDAAGYKASNASRLIMGGPMMGFALQSTAIPIVKTTNCLLAPTEKELPTPPPAQACIRCGMCAEACPVTLLPQQMYWYAQAKDHDNLKAHNLMDCIECGACSYACPSNIPLVQYYRASKADIRKAEAEHQKAEYSKQRFEQRQERLAKAEAEKEAKRKERQEKAAKAAAEKAKAQEQAEANQENTDATTQSASAAAVDPVQAAIERAKAKASGAAPTDPVADAKAKVESLKKRLQKAQDKLANAREMNDENLPAFESSVEKLKAKLAEAEAAVPSSDSAESSNAPVDPVQAAIDRAKAKAAGTLDVDPVADAESKIASLNKRLAKAEDKLANAREMNDDNLPAFESSVEKLKAKLADAEAELQKAKPGSDSAKTEAAKTDTATDAAVDPVQAAIDRAKAKAAGTLVEDPIADTKAKITSLEKRIAKAEDKLNNAREMNDDNLPAFESSVEKLKAKLDEAREQLGEFEGEQQGEQNTEKQDSSENASITPTEPEVDPNDPVAMAIAKAQAKRAGADADVDPKTKLENDIASLEKRIGNAQKKLEVAEIDAPDKADALRSSLEKLSDKLEAAQAELAQLND